MVRLADIIRGKTPPVRAVEKEAPRDEPVPEVSFNFVELYKRRDAGPAGPAQVCAGSAYERAMGLAEEAFENARSGRAIDCGAVAAAVDGLLQETVLGNEGLLAAAVSSSIAGGNFLFSHSVNTAVLSLSAGAERKLNMSKLRELGTAAFLHDIGCARIMDIVGKNGALNAEDVRAMRKHPLWGLETLKNINGLSDSVLKVAYEEHERLDGSGYPHGVIGSGRLHEHSTMIAACDVFEALIHDRPHRKAMSVPDAFKHMLAAGEAAKFDALTVRSLISRVGLYPIGSWAKLSTGEIAKVVSVNAGHPLKPKVKIVFDRTGWKLNHARVLDLSSDAAVQITSVMKDEEVTSAIDSSPS